MVKGLQQSDFSKARIKPQEGTLLQEFADTQGSGTASASAEEALPPNVFSNYTSPVEDEAVTVVVLDLLNTPIRISARQDELVKFLKKKPKGARSRSACWNRLQMIRGFTDDSNLLLAAEGKKASQRVRSFQDRDAPVR